MDYKTILVHAQAEAAALPRLEAAVALGGRFGATVMGVAAETWYPVAAMPDFGYVPAEVLDELQSDSQARLAAAEARFRSLLEGAACAGLCVTEMDYPRDAMVRSAACADLIVASRPSRTEAETLCAFPGDLIMSSGLPVLLVAQPAPPLAARRIVVGWKNTRESRRAVSDALPFLRRAETVHLVQIARAADREVALGELALVAGRLTRQAITVETTVLPEHGGVCETLESHAKSLGADLLVLGAYGHSRLRETVFGGVTESFLQQAAIHVLFGR